ncbi:MAG: YjbQ family protein [Bacteroidetes bacterium]|nr:YjbQ family protein [Bacteroidota bacterium]
MIQQVEFTLPEFERGFHVITSEVLSQLPKLPEKGLMNVFIKHTSAGITVNETADPTVLTDFEMVFNKIVPDELYYRHLGEEPDDMPAHVKTTLSGASVTIPITDGKPNLNPVQGLYLCEYRNQGGPRTLVVTIYS